MILGFLVGEDQEERRARFKTYELVGEFTRRFEARRGSLVCKTLLGGVDLGTDAGRREATGRNLFQTICPGYVRDATEILDEIAQGLRQAG